MLHIEARRINKYFGDYTAVSDVSCIILPGKVTGFLGPNGAGKTTLFNIICSDLKPDLNDSRQDGIFLCNEDRKSNLKIDGLPRYQIANLKIGKLYQDIKIFNDISILDNVIVSLFALKEINPLWVLRNFYKLQRLRKSHEAEAYYYIKKVGLDSINNLDKKPAKNLSYGQRKLLAFAILLAKNCEILIMDEPTAGLSQFYLHKVEDILFSLIESKKTIAIIEHNVHFLERIADVIYYMENGKIEFFGTAKHIINNNEIRKRYIGLQ